MLSMCDGEMRLEGKLDDLTIATQAGEVVPEKLILTDSKEHDDIQSW